MADPLRLLALVPARGGSKRLPRKNVLMLGGRPLIQWSIDAARESGVCIDVLVSTDDDEIAQASRDAGAMVPWLRPAELATDTAGSAGVISHALDWYEQAHGAVDAVLLLQPTSPFRSAKAIRGAVRTYADQAGTTRHPVVSVSPAASHPAWTFAWQDGELRPSLGWEPLSLRSQDLTPAYALNGALYVIPAEDARAARPIVRPGVLPFVMTDARESLDIDTADDWALASHWADTPAAGAR
ncbi:cytidylyltransferase domain-containing protein [Roseateles amylovorans]|uniref:Acylneuraminate cytidylyltransferase family protein n=1 Tax=Roseateles amylovorans TaxID=2978473 RepID=A0ABY6B0W4_9BURK|nr:acylneuraminate cytidylyltransferase family protein [Roseateles amylovorans]UXH77629.1 acylneuraminate cytidylyltransferase family protein [Roseateles amylovorans]